MKMTESFKRFLSVTFAGIFLITNINPVVTSAGNSSDKIVYPLQEVSKLECRFEKFSDLSSNCKQKLPILNTKDYKKYSKKNGGYNDYTRYYTVLWWSSYKYGWDIWNGWHQWTDIATAQWTPVYSMANWKVITAKSAIWWWKVVSIEHTIKGKKVVSNYSHLHKINVSVGKKVKAWEKIWEVWNTWNSTWNHLHFQIDLPSTFHPYYYNYKTCPYSYHDITEKWVCFNDLKKNTIDPLLFLESAWAVLNDIEFSTTNTKSNNSNNKSETTEDLSIFDRTVYVWYSSSLVKKVQEIFRDLKEYKWPISWDYKDIEDSIISYQISNNIIKSRNENWAWWFGPKTRNQAKHDYLNFLANGWKKKSTITTIVKNDIKTEKIERSNLLTREEIEAREVEDFLKKYNVELNFKGTWNNIKVWETRTLKLKITDRRWRWFKWSMPWNMNFVVDTTKVSVFPNKLYYFTDWKRDIKLTWLKTWNTTLYIKIWNKVIEKFKLKIYWEWQTIYPKSWKIISSKKIVIWEEKTGIVLLKDEKKSNLINIKYWWTFKLKTNDWVQVCLKTWSLKDIKKVYKKKCDPSKYKDTIEFTYNDTVWWLLLFDYKATSRDAKIELINNYKNENFNSTKLTVSNPKWLAKNYTYYNEVVDMLESWVVSWLKKWYFLEKRELIESDANKWIENTLVKLKENTKDSYLKSEIDVRLKKLSQEKASKFKTIIRKDFLEKSYKYLAFNNVNSISIDYRDLEDKDNKKANAVFDKDNTWKDKFWENYFRPNVKMTRWEWAYFLSRVINKNKQTFVTLK